MKREQTEGGGGVGYKNWHTVVVRCMQPRVLGCHLPVTAPFQ